MLLSNTAKPEDVDGVRDRHYITRPVALTALPPLPARS